MLFFTLILLSCSKTAAKSDLTQRGRGGIAAAEQTLSAEKLRGSLRDMIEFRRAGLDEKGQQEIYEKGAKHLLKEFIKNKEYPLLHDDVMRRLSDEKLTNIFEGQIKISNDLLKFDLYSSGELEVELVQLIVSNLRYLLSLYSELKRYDARRISRIDSLLGVLRESRKLFEERIRKADLINIASQLPWVKGELLRVVKDHRVGEKNSFELNLSRLITFYSMVFSAIGAADNFKLDIAELKSFDMSGLSPEQQDNEMLEEAAKMPLAAALPYLIRGKKLGKAYEVGWNLAGMSKEAGASLVGKMEGELMRALNNMAASVGMEIELYWFMWGCGQEEENYLKDFLKKREQI